MPLQLPNLDDRRYADLVAEALAKSPNYDPEWTNYNPSDPGITSIELFAYLTDMLLYRLNRVTDETDGKFSNCSMACRCTSTTPISARKYARLFSTSASATGGARDDYRIPRKGRFQQVQQPEVASSRWPGSLRSATQTRCVERRRPAQTAARTCQRRHPARTNRPQSRSAPRPGPDRSRVRLSGQAGVLTTRLHVTGPVTSPLPRVWSSRERATGTKADWRRGIRNALGPAQAFALRNGDGWPFGRDVYVSEAYKSAKDPRHRFVADVLFDSPAADLGTALHLECRRRPRPGLQIEDHQLPVYYPDRDHADIELDEGSWFVTVALHIGQS